MMTKGIFDLKRDKEVIDNKGFWCHACLMGKSAEEESPDPRYCLGCFSFLKGETGQDWLNETSSKPVPVPPVENTPVVGKIAPQGLQAPRGDILPPTTGARVTKKGVTKRQRIVGEGGDSVTAQIAILTARGFSCRAISETLRSRGIQLSHMAVHRRQTGQVGNRRMTVGTRGAGS